MSYANPPFGIVWDQEDRDIKKPPNGCRSFCARHVWGENYKINPDFDLQKEIEIKRKGTCNYARYQPGLSVDEAEKLHEKNEQNKKYNITLLVSIFAVIIAALSMFFSLN